MQTLKEEIKKKIIEAGKRRFECVGFKNTSMKEIANDVGISTGNIYRYFLTKSHLLDEILIEVSKEMTNFLDSMPESYKDFEKMKIYDLLIEKILKISKEKSLELKIMFSCCEQDKCIAFRENILNVFSKKIEALALSINEKFTDQSICRAIAKSLFEGISYIVRENNGNLELLRRNLEIYIRIMAMDMDTRVSEIAKNNI